VQSLLPVCSQPHDPLVTCETLSLPARSLSLSMSPCVPDVFAIHQNITEALRVHKQMVESSWRPFAHIHKNAHSYLLRSRRITCCTWSSFRNPRGGRKNTLPITLFGHLDEAQLPHASVRPLIIEPGFSLLKSKSISLLGDGGIPPVGCIEISCKPITLLGRWWWVFQRMLRCKVIN
jgi:hypothetical protein